MRFDSIDSLPEQSAMDFGRGGRFARRAAISPGYIRKLNGRAKMPQAMPGRDRGGIFPSDHEPSLTYRRRTLDRVPG
jgi:hypothetical protein